MKKYISLSLFIHSIFFLSLLKPDIDIHNQIEPESVVHFDVFFETSSDLNEKTTASFKKKEIKHSIRDNGRNNIKIEQFIEERLGGGESMTANLKPQKNNFATMDYAHQLKLYIEKHKFYPPLARKLKQTGLVKLHVEIDRYGNFNNVRLVEKCNHDKLNQAALLLVKKLARFKPLPDDLPEFTDFTIPIAYQLYGL